MTDEREVYVAFQYDMSGGSESGTLKENGEIGREICYLSL